MRTSGCSWSGKFWQKPAALVRSGDRTEFEALFGFVKAHQDTVAAPARRYFELGLVNPQHIRNIPRRKTDVSDAAWIADLLARG